MLHIITVDIVLFDLLSRPMVLSGFLKTIYWDYVENLGQCVENLRQCLENLE